MNMAWEHILLLITALCAYPSGMTACPSSCTCSGKKVDCSNQGLTSFPSDLPSDTQALILNDNSITRIPEDLAKKLPDLQILALQRNKIATISSTALQGLQHVRKLDLFNNLLTEVPSRALQRTKAHADCSDTLCYVDLRHNPLRTIRKYAFAWMQGLAVYVGESREELTVESHAFYGINSPLVQLSGIEKLNLENSLFIAPNITTIKFERAQIPVIKSYTFKDTRNLRSVTFMDCNITDMEKGAFSGIHYAISNTSSLTVLTFTGCNINVLPSEAFADTNLESVSIQNSQIRELQPNIFWGMSNIQFIEVFNSTFPSISKGVFSGLNHVDKILLENNKVASIESNAFSESMHISHIHIEGIVSASLHIKNDAFRDLSQVETLHIGGVAALHLAPSAFSGLVDVQTLRLSRLTIPLLRAHALSGLMRVGRLHAHDVRITRLQGYEALQPMAAGRGITQVSLEGVSLPCDCPAMLAYPKAMDLFSNNNVTCLYQQANMTQLDDRLITAMQDECRPPPPGDAAGHLLPTPLVLLASLALSLHLLHPYIPR